MPELLHAGAQLAHLYARNSDPIIIAAQSTGPSTTPALMTNMICRIIFALLANLVCLVPLRLLHRNREFAAVVFIIVIELKNFETVVNCLIWRDDDVSKWYSGRGLCDIGSYWDNATDILYSTCLLAIIRNLAQQVALLRANSMTSKEMRRRNVVQALIMFPLPIVQMAMTWPLTAQRYAIMTLVGCRWVGYGSWPYMILFVLPHFLVPLLTAAYSVLTYIRFRQLTKNTASALVGSGTQRANRRAQRARRRLYLVVVSVMVPYLPICLGFFIGNLLDTPIKPFNYDTIHAGPGDLPWNSILYLRSTDVKPWLFNSAWMPIITAVPIFIFFGMTKDAINDYRRFFVFIGLGRLFPNLRDEHDPDRTATNERSSFGSSFRSKFPSGVLTNNSRSSEPQSRQNPLESFDSSFSEDISTIVPAAQGRSQARPYNRLETTSDIERGIVQQPQPARQQQHSYSISDDPIQLPHRNPFLFRTTLNIPIIPFSRIFKSKSDGNIHNTTSNHDMPLNPLAPATNPTAVSTRVWADEEETTMPINHGVSAGVMNPQRRGSIHSPPRHNHQVVVETTLVYEAEDARR